MIFAESDADGSTSGFFPDVPGCFFAGDSLNEAFKDAQGALTAHFETLCELGQVLPAANPVERHLQQREDEFVGGQWLLVDINMNQFDGRAERINITLPRRLISKIDVFVHDNPEFSNRSAFLAARRVLPG